MARLHLNVAKLHSSSFYCMLSEAYQRCSLV